MPSPSPVVAVLAVLLLAGCGGTPVSAPSGPPASAPASTSPAATPSPSPTPARPQLTGPELEALLLTPPDVPQVPLHVVELSPGPLGPPEPGTVPPNVCRPELAPEARAVATFLTEPYTEVQSGPSVVQHLLLWPDEDAARAAYASAQEAAATCGTFTNEYDVTQQVSVLGPVEVAAPAEAFQYETKQVPVVPVPGDVVTVARVGRVTVELRSSVRAPSGLTVPQWQAQLAARAVEVVAAAAP